MAATKSPRGATPLPDWWARERQRRQVGVLILMLMLLALTGFYYWVSYHGRTGYAAALNFDTSNYIVFIRQDDAGDTSLCTIRADGTDLRQLTDPGDKFEKAAPAWSIDGTTLLYVSGTRNKVRQIFTYGRSGAEQLTYGTGNKDAPVANPDGKHAAFVTQGAIKTVYLNGNEVYQIMPEPRSSSEDGNDAHGAAEYAMEIHGPFLSAGFSPDGQGIAGVQEIGAEENAASLGPMRLTVGDQVARVLPSGATRSLVLDGGKEVSVVWDPQGKRVFCAFTEAHAPVQSENGSRKTMLLSGIRIWNLEDHRNPRAEELFIGRGYTIAPRHIALSPDGARIAFEAWRIKDEESRELRGIVVMEVNKGRFDVMTPEEADRLTYFIPAKADAGLPQNPRWSPDGDRLLFEMARPNGKHDLWVVTRDGLNPINLTRGIGDNTQASWSPARPK